VVQTVNDLLRLLVCVFGSKTKRLWVVVVIVRLVRFAHAHAGGVGVVVGFAFAGWVCNELCDFSGVL